MIYVAVPGTHATRRARKWSDPDSPLSVYLMKSGLENAAGIAIPYEWSTDLDIAGGHEDWKAAGYALCYYALAYPQPELVIISHSHGRQPVLYAASMGLKVSRWLDVNGPIREDMAKIDAQARPNIGAHVRLHAGKKDWWQVLGELFDGHVGWRREDPKATKNIAIPGDHTQILESPEFFPLWQAWIPYLRGAK